MLLRTRPAVDLVRTVGVHQRGRRDPTTIVTPTEVWRASRTPDGPGTLHLSALRGEIVAEAWGAGAGWLLAAVPDLLGDSDEPDALVPCHPAVAAAQRRLPGLRISRSRTVLPALVAAVLAQRVTSVEARRSWLGVAHALGEPAPGPRRLLLPPDPGELAGRPYWWYHRFGVDRRRADAIHHAATRAARLEALVDLPLAEAERQLRSLPGVGAWTVATVAGPSFGDPDAVVIGDYGLPHLVTWALAGERRGTDERMLELLEPYRGQRGRVQRLLVLTHSGPPRRAPRQAIAPVATW